MLRAKNVEVKFGIHPVAGWDYSSAAAGGRGVLLPVRRGDERRARLSSLARAPFDTHTPQPDSP